MVARFLYGQYNRTDYTIILTFLANNAVCVCDRVHIHPSTSPTITYDNTVTQAT